MYSSRYLPYCRYKAGSTHEAHPPEIVSTGGERTIPNGLLEESMEAVPWGLFWATCCEGPSSSLAHNSHIGDHLSRVAFCLGGLWHLCCLASASSLFLGTNAIRLANW